MNQNRNRRFQKTEQRIQDYAMELLKSDPDTVLTVSAICEGLPINRSSFYLHYKDVQDVLDDLLLRFHAEHMELIHKENVFDAESPLRAALNLSINFLIKNESFYRYYFDHCEYSPLVGSCAEECLELLMPPYETHAGLSELQLLYLKEFIQAGNWAVMKRWLNNDKTDSIKELCTLFFAVTGHLEPVNARN
ncbi:MAG: TetR/AcrR family transcriptional regulator [Oscillospiraceae bacterium]|nr:TetR/AcrR family transcriptional regulator [Oscillospiraceae bacterium]